MQAQECFIQHERMIYGIAKKFQIEHGGDFDELKSEARQLFMVAYNSYNPDMSTWRNQNTGAKKAGSLKTWIRFNIWKGLTETARRIARRHNNLPRIYIDLDHRHSPTRFDAHRFIRDLSPDAARVARLAVDRPVDIATIARTRRGGETDRNGEPHAKNIGAAIHEFLGELGWDVSRIAKSFSEIREALV